MRSALRALLLSALCLTILHASPAGATTDSARALLMDGDSNDFAADEILLLPGEELDIDSWWGENNDINQLKASWDSQNLYVAVDGFCWGNNILYFIDTAPGGMPDLDRANAWSRKLFFFGRQPDFFLGTWDSNTEPQFWRVLPGAQEAVEQVNESAFDAHASFSQGRPGASMEAALPWSLLYPSENGGVPENAEIGLVAVVVSKDDHQSGPDCAPNSASPMPRQSGDYAFLDNFAVLHVDRDGDGQPDLGISPNLRTGDALSDTPPLTLRYDPSQDQVYREYNQVEATPKAISPNGDGLEDSVAFSVTLNLDSLLDLDIFDATGRRVRRLLNRQEAEQDVPLQAVWDGRDEDGKLVDAGLYFARVEILFAERYNIPLAVLR